LIIWLIAAMGLKLVASISETVETKLAAKLSELQP
jgi:hypothetical protein